MHFAQSPKMAAAALITVLLGLPQMANATKPAQDPAAAKCAAMIDQSPNNKRLLSADSDCKLEVQTLTVSDRGNERTAPLSHSADEEIYNHSGRQNYDREYRHNNDRGYGRDNHRNDRYHHGNDSEREFIRQLDRINYEIDMTRSEIRDLQAHARHGHNYRYESRLRELGRRLDWLKDRKRELKRRRDYVDYDYRPYRSQG